jgi:predicted ATPase
VGEARGLDDVMVAVAEALGLSPESAGEENVERIGRALVARGAALVVLDDAESVAAHLAEALGAFLARAPAVRWLVVSREPLGAGARLELGALPDDEAAALFEERAAAACPGGLRRASDGALVHEIVRRLDGVPLAIELAAAWVGVLTPDRLLARIAERFALLQGGARGAPARHATLRAAIDWSWELLPVPERWALAQCAVFRGGFAAGAAGAVLVTAPDAPEEAAPLALVHALCARSLVRSVEGAAPAGEPRFALPESIRAYAAERLEETGRRAEVEERHAAHYAAAGLALDCDNLGAAFERALASSHAGAACMPLARGAAHANAGRADEARAALADAAAALESQPRLLDIVALYWGLVDLTVARRAAAAGDDIARRAALDSARARLARVRAEGAPSEAPVAVRIAAGLLERAIARAATEPAAAPRA